MMTTQKPEAIYLADLIERYSRGVASKAMADDYCEAAAELRRLHAENTTLQQGYDAARLQIESLQAQLESIGAGGVEPLRCRDHFRGATEMVPAGWAISYDGKTPHTVWTEDDGDLLDLEVKRQGGTACKMKLYARVEK